MHTPYFLWMYFLLEYAHYVVANMQIACIQLTYKTNLLLPMCNECKQMICLHFIQIILQLCVLKFKISVFSLNECFWTEVGSTISAIVIPVSCFTFTFVFVTTWTIRFIYFAYQVSKSWMADSLFKDDFYED